MAQNSSHGPNFPWNRNAEQQNQYQNRIQNYNFYRPETWNSSAASSSQNVINQTNPNNATDSTFNYSLEQLNLPDNLSSLKPLGLKLNNSPELARWIERQLNRPPTGKTRLREPKSQAASDKPKPVITPASMLKIGSWERVAKNTSDLTTKCYFAKRKLVWEILEGGLKRKMEMQWSDIIAIDACIREKEPGVLRIELNQCPSFFQEKDPQPRKHTIWMPTSDFTGGQASKCRRHEIVFSPGNLDKPYKSLLQADQNLSELSSKPFPSLEDPYFPSLYPDFNPTPNSVTNPNPQQQLPQLSSPSPIPDEQMTTNAAMRGEKMLPEPNPNVGVVSSNKSVAAATTSTMGNQYLAPRRMYYGSSSGVASLNGQINNNNNNNLLDTEPRRMYYGSSSGAALSNGQINNNNNNLLDTEPRRMYYGSSSGATLSNDQINSNNLLDTEPRRMYYGSSSGAALSNDQINRNNLLDTEPQRMYYGSSSGPALSNGQINSNSLLDAEMMSISHFSGSVSDLDGSPSSVVDKDYLMRERLELLGDMEIDHDAEFAIRPNEMLYDQHHQHQGFAPDLSAAGLITSGGEMHEQQHQKQKLGFVPDAAPAGLITSRGELYEQQQQQQVFVPDHAATGLITSGGEMYEHQLQQQEVFVPDSALADLITNGGKMYEQQHQQHEVFVPDSALADLITNGAEIYEQQQDFVPNPAAGGLNTSGGEMCEQQNPQQQQTFVPDPAAAGLITSGGEMYEQQNQQRQDFVQDPSATDLITTGGEMNEQQQSGFFEYPHLDDFGMMQFDQGNNLESVLRMDLEQALQF